MTGTNDSTQADPTALPRLDALRRECDWHWKRRHKLVLLYGPEVEQTRDGRFIDEVNRGKYPVFGFRVPSPAELVRHVMAKHGNVAWVVGEEHLVIDVDTRKPHAQASYAKLWKLCGLPRTRTIRTGSGGWHEYLRLKLPPGITIRQNHPDYPGIYFIRGNHYVVIAGSMHRNGRPYTVEHDVPVAECPPALVELLKRDVVAASKNASYTREEIEWLLVPNANDVEYDDWIKVGMGVQFELGEEGFDLWDAWSAKSPKYNPAETRRKWESFGVTHTGVPATGGTIELILREVRQRTAPRQTAQERAGDALVELGAEVAGEEAAPEPDTATGEDEGPRKVTKAFAAVYRWAPLDDRPRPPPEFVIGQWIQRGQVGTIVAEGGTGKTVLALSTAIDLALGTDWMGAHPVARGSSLLLSRDDSQEDLETALTWICRDRGLSAAERAVVYQKVRVVSLKGVLGATLIEAVEGKRAGYQRTRFAQELGEHLQGIEDLQFVFLDTARQFNVADTNDEAAGAALIDVGSGYATEGRIAVAFLHHTGKAIARAGVVDMYAGIGSSVYADNSRFVLRLIRVEGEALTRLAVPSDWAWEKDDTVLQLSSTRGSLIVRNPEPLYYVRREFALIPLPARKRSPAEIEDAFFARVKEELLAHPGGLTKSALLDAIGGKRQTFFAQVDTLISDGKLTLEAGPRRAQVVTLSREEA